jgi:hypothetical protein
MNRIILIAALVLGLVVMSEVQAKGRGGHGGGHHGHGGHKGHPKGHARAKAKPKAHAKAKAKANPKAVAKAKSSSKSKAVASAGSRSGAYGGSWGASGGKSWVGGNGGLGVATDADPDYAIRFAGGYYYVGTAHPVWARSVFSVQYNRTIYWNPVLLMWYYWDAAAERWYPVSYLK